MKTSELTGPALDWAVAKAEGMTESLVFGRGVVRDTGYCVERPNGTRLFYVLRNVWDRWFEKCETHPWGSHVGIWAPSTNWLHGGPIIEREGIDLNYSNYEGTSGEVWDAACVAGKIFGGPTPLIAAMRCYVASRLGDEVEVPEELKGVYVHST
jgi:hypothetical protein